MHDNFNIFSNTEESFNWSREHYILVFSFFSNARPGHKSIANSVKATCSLHKLTNDKPFSQQSTLT